jgi:CO/xanthine dehydrogenase Mo-binding subunit
MEQTTGRDYTDGGRYRVIGTRPVRHDGVDKVTGQAIFGADVRLPGMLYGKVLRSPHAHARIVAIDASRALALPGVKAVVTADDLVATADRMARLGETNVNIREIAANSLASGKVLYQGHAVAAVAATSAHLAEEALDLIDVRYEVLPAVTDVRAAMAAGAALLDETRTTRQMGQDSGQPSNIASHNRSVLGDPAAGFAAADVIVEREFSTATVHQGYIEPHNTTVWWKADDTITIWVSTQGPFDIRSQVADMLQVPLSRIKVIPCEIGGAFGGKFPAYMEPAAALLSRRTGHPVKMVMTRAEVFQASGPGPGSWIKVRLGARSDGRLVAAEAALAYEAGAFPGSAVGAAAVCIFAPYDIANVAIDAYDVVVNKPKSSAYRAPGAPNAAFAAESAIDELAVRLQLDPLELRQRNAAREGTRRADGVRFGRIGYAETLAAARDSDHYRAPLSGPHRGRGVASGFWFNGGGQSAAVVTINANGTVNLQEGSVDIGGSRVSMAMIVAETLGLRPEDVTPSIPDTNSIGYTDGTGGSRVTYATGQACYLAAEEAKRLMCQRAARQLEVEEGDVEFADGAFVCRSDPGRRLSFIQVAEAQGSTGGPITAAGSVNAGAPGNAYGTHIADVEVDPETGKVTLLRYTVVQDVGKAIHPSYVEGQLQGGAAQGIGWALSEGYFYRADGTLANATFLDYRMPTALDLPMIEPILVEVANPSSPHGIRGVGEVPIVPPLGCIANAVYHAIGVRLTELPMSPDRVLAGLQARPRPCSTEPGESA